MIQSVIDRALALVGNGYIMGAKGQTCSPAFRRQQANQYPEWEKTIMGEGAKWDGKPVWDCAQLTREVAKAAGVTLVSGATSQWNKTDWEKRGVIDTLPPGETVFVYRWANNAMQHTGVALGDGRCVHAWGTAKGVVLQRVDDHAWTHWAKPKWKEADKVSLDILYEAIAKAASGTSVNLRAEPGGKVINKVPLGDTVDVIADAGSGWVKVVYDNDVGYMQKAFLNTHESLKESNATLSSTPFEERVVQLLEGIYDALKKP